MSLNRESLPEALSNVYQQEKVRVTNKLLAQADNEKQKSEINQVMQDVTAGLDQQIPHIIDQVLSDVSDINNIANVFCQKLRNVIFPNLKLLLDSSKINWEYNEFKEHVNSEFVQSRQSLDDVLNSLKSDSAEVSELKNANPEDVLFFPEELMGQPTKRAFIDNFTEYETRKVPKFIQEYIQKLGGFEWTCRYFIDEKIRSVNTFSDAEDQVHVFLLPSFANRDEEYGKPDILNGLCRAKLAESIDPIFAQYGVKIMDAEGQERNDKSAQNFVAQNMNFVTTPISDIWSTDLRHNIDPEVTKQDLQTVFQGLQMQFIFPQLDQIVKSETGNGFNPVEMLHIIANIKANVKRYDLENEKLTVTRFPQEIEDKIRAISDPYQVRDLLVDPRGQQRLESREFTYQELLDDLDKYIIKHPAYAKEGDMTNPFQMGNINPIANFYTHLPALPDDSDVAVGLYEEVVNALLKGGQYPFTAHIKRDKSGKAFFEITLKKGIWKSFF